MDLAKKILRAALYVFSGIAVIAILVFISLFIAANRAATPEGDVADDPPAPAYEMSESGAAAELESPQLPEPPAEDFPPMGTDDAAISADLPSEAVGDEVNEDSAPEPAEEPVPDIMAPIIIPELDEDMQSAIDRIAQRHGAVGVQVAVIENGVVAGTYVYGYATRGTQPMTADTKIRVASISKAILAMVIMRQSELGRLDIDADIGDYWGAPVRNPNHSAIPITMRQMLAHTSSIRVYEHGFAAGGELIRSRFLDGSCFGGSTPGAIASYNYNNYAYAALGVTVEVATGMTVNELAAQDLFMPLGIDAAFGSGSIADTDKLATLYTHGGGVGRSVERQKGTMGSTFPGECGEEFPGGLTISANDLAKLIAVLINRGEYNGVRILSPRSVALMESSQGRTGGFYQCLPMRRRTDLFGEDEIFYHTGSNFGVFTLASYNPNNGNGVVVLTSGANGARDANFIPIVCAEISEYIYRELRGR